MKNYTTQTAALKATTVDTRILDTKILKVNVESLEDVILQTSPKGINNAVRISTTIGSILDKQISTNGINLKLYSSGLLNFYFDVANDGIVPSEYGYPTNIIINGHTVIATWEKWLQEWDCQLWNEGDNWE